MLTTAEVERRASARRIKKACRRAHRRFPEQDKIDCDLYVIDRMSNYEPARRMA